MAGDKTISGLTAAGAVASGDLFRMVDISDTTDSVNGSDRKVTAGALATAFSSLVGTVYAVQVAVSDPNGAAITTGDGKAFFRVNSLIGGKNLTGVAAAVTTASTSGSPTIQIANVTDAVDMLSTKLTIDANETDSITAGTPAVIDTTKDDVVAGDMLRIDIDVAGTGAKGLIVELTFA